MRYEKYQSTEIPWVISIPSHWNQIRNGGIFDYHQDKVGSQFANYDLLSLTTQGIRRKNIHDASGKVPASFEGYQEVNQGDMVFCLFDLDCSAVFSGLSNYHGMITSAYDVMKPKEEVVNAHFLDYWFQSVFFGRYYKIFSKSVRYTINYEIFKAIKTPVPPREEQDQIVRYLDWKVSQINKLIHGYQKQIRFLSEKMQYMICQAVLHGLNKKVEIKQVDIQNITEIPAHWSVLQNKRIFAERSEFSETGTETLLSVSKHFGVKPYYDLDDNEKFATIKPADSLIGYKKVMKNDLAMNIMRARNGSFGVSEYNGIVSPAYAVYRPIINCNPKYLHYLLRTPHVIGIFESYSYGIAEHRRRLYPFDFLRLYLPVPPKSEQDEIVEYIKSEQIKNEKIISSIQNKIDLLREYRTRLISDIVTGQIDVRGVQIPDYIPEEDVPENEEVSEEEIEEEMENDGD